MEHIKTKNALCIPSITLLLIGGINWGLVGLGILINPASNWNVVNLLFGGWSVVEGIIYLLVGIMAIKVIVFMFMGRKCAL